MATHNKTQKSAPVLLGGVAKARAIVLKWQESIDPQHETMWIWKFPTALDATNMTNGVLLEKSPARRKDRDEDDLNIGTTYRYRIQSQDTYGNLSAMSAILAIQYTGVNTSELVGTIGNAQIADNAIDSIKLANGAVTTNKLVDDAVTNAKIGPAAVDSTEIADNAVIGTKIANAALTAAKFAASIAPVEIFATNPTTGNFEGRMVYNTTDKKLYRHNGTAFVASVAAADMTGSLTNAQIADLDAAKLTGTLNIARIADAALTAAKFAAGIKPVEIFASVAAAGAATPEGRVIYAQDTNKLYRATGSAWEASVPSTDISGQLTDAQVAALNANKLTGTIDPARIASGALDATKFASTIRPVEIFANTAAAGTATAGRVIFVTADNKLYRGNGTTWIASTAATDITGQLTDAQVAALAASKITGQIVGTQITDGAITTAKMTANTIDGSVITANTLNASKILAGSITTDRMTANTIDGDRIAAGTLDASKITADSITAGQIQAGAIGASEIAAGAVTAAKLAVGTNRNWIPNSDFLSIAGWGIEWSPEPASFTTALRTDIYAALGSAFEIRQINGNQTNGSNAVEYGVSPYNPRTGAQDTYEVEPNEWYEFSVYCYGHRSKGMQPYIQWLTEANVHISYASLGVMQANQGGNPNQLLSAYAFAWNKFQAPATAKHARLFFRHKGTMVGQVDSFVWIKRPYFGKANPNQTEATPWSEGGVTLIQGGNIVTGAIVTSHMTANTIDGSVITANTLNASKIVAGSITTDRMTANTINGDRIAAGTIAADKIVANSITAGQIATGAISADEIAVGAVTAGKVYVGAFSENSIYDADFESGLTEMWPNGANGTVTNIADVTSPGGGRVLQFNRGVTDNTVSMYRTYKNHIPVEAGDRYYADFTIKGSGASAAGAYLRLLFFDSNKAAIADPASGLVYRDIYANGAITTTYTTRSGAYTIPVGTKYVVPQIYHHNSSTIQHLYVSGVTFKKMISGELVVDGAISTNHMTANTINGDRITANTLNASKIVAGSITTDRMTANTINGDRIAAGTIAADKIVANSITAGQIATGAITTDELAAGAVTATKINVSSLDAISANIGNLQVGTLNIESLPDLTNMLRQSDMKNLSQFTITQGDGVSPTPTLTSILNNAGDMGTSKYKIRITGVTEADLNDSYLSTTPITPCRGGIRHVFSAWAKAVSGTPYLPGSFRTTVTWYSMDASGNPVLIGESTEGDGGFVAVGVPVFMNFAATAPANAAFLSMNFRYDANFGGGGTTSYVIDVASFHARESSNGIFETLTFVGAESVNAGNSKIFMRMTSNHTKAARFVSFSCSMKNNSGGSRNITLDFGYFDDANAFWVLKTLAVTLQDDNPLYMEFFDDTPGGDSTDYGLRVTANGSQFQGAGRYMMTQAFFG